MSTRLVGLLLATIPLISTGCDLLEPSEPSAEDIPEPVDLSFGGALSGTVQLADDLDPTLLRLGAFRTRAEVETELTNGDLGTAEMSLSVRSTGEIEVQSLTSDRPVGVDRFLFTPLVLATMADDDDHAWDLPLPVFGSDEFVMIAWYDEDGDGSLALSEDGPGSEYADNLSKPKPSIEPTFQLVLKVVWWANGDWVGYAGGVLSDGRRGHEEPLSWAGPEDWEAQILLPLRP